MSNIEPFGYFKSDACGWTDCHDDDEGAIPLWDNAALCAIEKQRDELMAALDEIRHWFESERKSISKGNGSKWSMWQCEAQMAVIDGAINREKGSSA